jgi:hypothetical protein
MKTAKEIEASFRADLKALLTKYKAEITTEDHYNGYAECGEDIRMTVNIGSVYAKDNCECIQEYTEFDLGRWIDYKDTI